MSVTNGLALNRHRATKDGNHRNHPGELPAALHTRLLAGERDVMHSDAPVRYRIMFRGECGNVLQGILRDAAIESRRGWTCVIVTVGGEAAFYELLDRFQDLALQVVSINQLDADAPGADGVRAAPGQAVTGRRSEPG
jgi:hypothetical protein